MSKPFMPIVPPKELPTWEYEAWRKVSAALEQSAQGLAAIVRGELPDGSGNPAIDLTKFFYKPGLPSGQTGYGGVGPGEDLIFSSTINATKGTIYLGSALGSGYDEVNNRLGIGTASPEAKLHVYGLPTAGATYTPASDCTGIVGDLWQANGAAAWFTTLLTGVVGGDDDSLSTSAGGPPSTTRNFGVVLDGALSSSVDSWTITYIARRSGVMFAFDTMTFRITRSDGTTTTSAPIYPYVSHTQAYVSYTAVVSGSTAAGWGAGSGIREQTPNSCAVTFAHTNQPPYAAIRYLRVSPTEGGSTGTPLTIVERTANVAQSYSIWRDENDVTVASITSTGAGKFQNVILEDPGSGTGTVTLKAPTGVADWAMTLPANDGDTNEILQTNGSGVTDWIAPSTLATRIQHRWAANGPFRVDTDVDGAWVAPTALTISSVKFWRRAAGSSGQTIVDLNKNGTTMYTTQANRPKILASAGNNAIHSATLPDVVAVAAGDRVTIDTDEIEVGRPRDYTLLIEGA